MLSQECFVGFHTRIGDKSAVKSFIKLIEEGLAPLQFNAVIIELNPGYNYKCYPEFSTGTLDCDDAAKIKEVCKKHGIKVIPLFQCLSHQCPIMGGEAWPLLKAHPEFCETPQYINGAEWPDIYCHSWCASNDEIYKYIFPMMDEIIDAFEADVVHIGLDEVFEIGEDSCELCRGKDKAELLARTVKILHDHLAEKGIQTMMWGDRLLDADKLGYQMWEGDKFGMHKSFDMTDKITRDIIITDWHYDMHSQGYPSIGQFMEGGFTTIAALGANPNQAEHFWKHCLEYIYLGKKFHWPGRLGGLLFTQWKSFTPEIAKQILFGIHGGDLVNNENAEACLPFGLGQAIARIVPKGKCFRK